MTRTIVTKEQTNKKDQEILYTELRFWARKFLEAIATLLLVTMLSFLLMRLSPVDPAEAYAKRKSPVVTQSQIDKARQDLGLDKPLIVQYGRWLGKALQGDLGISMYSEKPVVCELKKTLPETAGVVAVYAVITLIGTVIFGVLNYLARNNRWRHVLKACYFISFSVPSFFLASVYMDVFALKLGWVRVQGNTGFWRYFPPAFLLGIMSVGLFSQMLGKHLETEMKKDYAFFAMGRGLSEKRVLVFHAMRHAIVKILPNILQQLGLCFSTTAIIEGVFSLQGIGQAVVTSISQRDSTMLHGQLLVLALAIAIANILADFLRRMLLREQRLKESV